MKRKLKIHGVATALFFTVVSLFFVFFLYMGFTENISVYTAEQTHSYYTVTDYDYELIPDETAPAGVRRVYRWTLDPDHASESCLCFYISHHCAEVFYDGVLMYRLSAAEGNRIGASISSNWCSVPVNTNHAGQEVTVVLTPLFDSVVTSDVEFLVGSHFSIFQDLLFRDLAQLFLSLLCIVLGLFIIAVYVYFLIHDSTSPWNILFLGSFSVIVGLWRIADIKTAPLLFPANPMVLGYVTIGALFLCSSALLMHISTMFPPQRAVPLLVIAALESLCCLGVLALQVLGILDFKEMLTVSHILLIVTILCVPVLNLLHRKKEHHPGHGNRLYLLPLAGIILDLISFYRTRSSSYIIYTITAFIIYALIIFIGNIRATTRKAYTDSRTGLGNKARWQEIMDDHTPVAPGVGVIMLDMNNLKKTNDSLGHEAGDRMIFSFSNILRNTLPSSSLICRWGGDEFAVMVTGTTREKLYGHITALHAAAEAYNAASGNPHISFAAGFALSTEYPGLTGMELLSVADSQMYLDKQRWHAAQ